NIPFSSFVPRANRYIARVSAISKIPELSSDFGESSQIITKMAGVPAVNIKLNDPGTQYTVSWVPVDGSDSYTIQVLDLNNKNKPPVIIEAGKDATSFDIPISQMDGYNNNSNFQVGVRANGRNYFPGDFTNAPDTIPRPVDLVKVDWKAAGDKLLTFDSNTGLYWLSWKLWLDVTRDQMDDKLKNDAAFAGF